MMPSTDDHLPLTPSVCHILLVLADGPNHGYGIMQQVEEIADMTMGPGTLYGAVKRLLKKGLIEERDDHPAPDDDKKRRYYALTPLGQRVLEAEVARMRTLVQAAERRNLT